MRTCIAYITKRVVFEVKELLDPTEVIKDMTHNSTFNTSDAVVINDDVESIKVDLHPKVETVAYRNNEEAVIS